jgi:hypothetical protein
MKYVVVLVLAAILFGCDSAVLTAPVVSGPVRCWPRDSLWFYFRSTSVPGDSVSYQVLWGDGLDTAWSAWQAAGTELSARHAFPDTGLFPVQARSRNAGGESPLSDTWFVDVRDFAPSPPHRPAGPETLAVNDTAAYVTLASHLLLKHVSIQFDWGDTLAGWGAFVNSGEPFSLHHSYAVEGVYAIRARARDSLGHQSDWSQPESVLVRAGFTASGSRLESSNQSPWR